MVEESKERLSIVEIVFGICGDCKLGKKLIYKDDTIYLPLRCFDAILRGISQVCFASNPISGLLILIGLYLGGPMVCLGTLVCTFAAYLSALYFKQNSEMIQDGITQFNGVLVGSVVFSLYPLLYKGSLDTRMWIVTVLGGVLSVPIQVALVGLLNGVKATFKNIKGESLEFGVPGFTLPFNLTACLVMSVLQQKTASSEEEIKVLPSEDITVDYLKVFIGIIKSMGQVYAVDTLEGSILMWIGIFIYSPLLAVWEFAGAALGSIIACLLDLNHLDSVYAGIWGYCPILTAGALGCFFAHTTLKSIPLVSLGIMTTVFLQKTLIPFLQIGNLPVFTFPFVLTSWFMLLVTTENSVLLRVENPDIPEKNFMKLWKESKKTQLTGDEENVEALDEETSTRARKSSTENSKKSTEKYLNESEEISNDRSEYSNAKSNGGYVNEA